MHSFGTGENNATAQLEFRRILRPNAFFHWNSLPRGGILVAFEMVQKSTFLEGYAEWPIFV